MHRSAVVVALLGVATSLGAQQQAPTVQRMLPDISAVGDIVGDFSPKGSTQEDRARFLIREIELALQAAIDPYFRGDVFLGFSDAEGVHIEQAFMTTTAIPAVELRIGRFMMPFGKQNTTHRHDLNTLEYPWVIQRFLGEEGMKGTGLYISRVIAPLGFYQELQLAAVEKLGEVEGLAAETPSSDELNGLGVSARLRNYWDVSQSANLELSASIATGRREQPMLAPLSPEVNATLGRVGLVGGDVTFRWRPLQDGLYKSFIAQGEFYREVNERVADDPNYGGPNRDFSGAYGFARWQLSRRWFLGGRYDWLEDPELGGETLTAGSGYLTWFPSEFSKLVLGYERLMPTGLSATNRILVQASFAIGPHKPHPF
jgi:hypothetical protein